jgi:hypothetical protein
MALRWAAEGARRIAIDNLNTRLIAAKRQEPPNTSAEASQLELLVNRVERLQDGAFAPWTNQPLIRAFLVPVLTYGATVLVHNYAIPVLGSAAG